MGQRAGPLAGVIAFACTRRPRPASICKSLSGQETPTAVWVDANGAQVEGALQFSLREPLGVVALINRDMVALAELLSAEQRKEHQQVLAAAYLAFVNAENARFLALSTHAKSELGELAGHVETMRMQLAELEAPSEQLGLLGKGLDVLARLAQTLQIP